ncbi:hypothetical protein Q4610_01120 [Sphingobium sp. HBC34]|uniref:Uncharacterized protein n=1 Tax=Sphingobium cyanobacteriorum TaxID=3063954 RepID=A0ABT8ZIM7_9SPHN|nr:hypothetical protein [Sphingobium sp. HBC34]MDO7833635.1 hypothetical protein [Sphingobium sp. HBC34]
MNWPWVEGRSDDDALPRWHHWLIAAATLFVMGIAVPLFAAFV